MTGRVIVLDSSHSLEWDSWLHRLPASYQDVHFTFRYHQLYEMNGDGKIRCFIYTEAEQIYFYPFLIRPVPNFSQLNDIETVYGYTGPLSNCVDHDFMQRADQAFAAYCLSEKVICEFVRFHPLLANQEHIKHLSDYTLVHLRDYVAVELDRSYGSIEAEYTSSNRNKIRKAIKCGMTTEEDPGGKNFAEFTNIYLDNMKRLSATAMYFFSSDFFIGLKELAKESGTLIHAKMNGTIVGSTLFLKGGFYGHYFLSSSTEYGRKNAAGNLMLDEGIKWCLKNGLKRLHLGGGLTGDANDQLLQFKMNFSKSRVAFFIGKRIHDKEAYDNVITSWEKEHPEKAEKNKGLLQRYRT